MDSLFTQLLEYHITKQSINEAIALAASGAKAVAIKTAKDAAKTAIVNKVTDKVTGNDKEGTGKDVPDSVKKKQDWLDSRKADKPSTTPTQPNKPPKKSNETISNEIDKAKASNAEKAAENKAASKERIKASLSKTTNKTKGAARDAFNVAFDKILVGD